MVGGLDVVCFFGCLGVWVLWLVSCLMIWLVWFVCFDLVGWMIDLGCLFGFVAL